MHDAEQVSHSAATLREAIEIVRALAVGDALEERERFALRMVAKAAEGALTRPGDSDEERGR